MVEYIYLRRLELIRVLVCNLHATTHFYTNMLTKRKKENAIKDVRRHDSDTGSPEAQVAILTKQIEDLSKHLKKNAKDFHSRRGLLQMVADRRKHLKYLERKDAKAYKALIKKLDLKK